MMRYCGPSVSNRWTSLTLREPDSRPTRTSFSVISSTIKLLTKGIMPKAALRTMHQDRHPIDQMSISMLAATMEVAVETAMMMTMVKGQAIHLAEGLTDSQYKAAGFSQILSESLYSYQTFPTHDTIS